MIINNNDLTEMMKVLYRKKKMLALLVAILVPALLLSLTGQAQSLGDHIYSLHGVLEQLYDQMLPLCSRMIDVGRGIAGLAALTYISVRVWRHIARAEPVDFFPLLRPFAIGMVIMLFPDFLGLLNGVLKPVVTATAAMGGDAQEAIQWHILQEEQSAKQTPPIGSTTEGAGNSNWQKYEQPDGTTDDKGFFSGLASAFSFFNLKNYFKQFITQLVEILYDTAGLCVDTIRTFYLIVLAILGPLVLGLSVFDGFQHTLSNWLARYINIYMWLPVANLFGAITSKILENMITLDQSFYTTTAYVIFMLISVVGYTTVPNVASYIIHAGGRDTLLHKVSTMTQQVAKIAVAAMI